MAVVSSSVATQDSVASSSRPIQAWLVIISASWFFFYEFMILNMFNAINEPLMQEFHISAATLGWLSSFYSLASILFLFPAGMILDRVSTRRLILIAMTICVTATVVFAQAGSIALAEVCRFAMGIGGAFCLLSAVRLASRWFEPKQMAFVIGMVVTMAFIGGSVAQYPMTDLTQQVGWRHALLVVAGMGALMWLMIFIFVKDYPPEYNHNRDASADSKHSLELPSTIKLVAANVNNWLGGLYTSLMNLPIFLLGMYGTMYLEQVHHLARSQAALVTMMLFIGTMIGSPVIGWISDKMGRRRSPMLFFGVLSLLVMSLLIWVPGWSEISLMVLFFAIGYFTSAQIITYPLVAESNRHEVTGAATGLASTLIMAGLYAQPLFGKLLDWHWNGAMHEGLRAYTLSDFNLAMSVMPIAFVIGIVGALFLKETYCKAVDEQ